METSNLKVGGDNMVELVNDFFKEKVSGPSKGLSVQRAVEIACGGRRIFMSKRLSPPLCICNGRIYADDEFVFSSDIEMRESAKRLHLVAETFGVKLRLFYEHGNDAIWSSEEPEKMNLYGKVFDSIEEAYKVAKPYSDQSQRQWLLDRGLVRRTPREWFRDFKSSLRWKFYDLKRSFKQYLTK